jgi:tRNA(Ile)-lysidine synthase
MSAGAGPPAPAGRARGPRAGPATRRVDAALRAALAALTAEGLTPGATVLVGVSGGQDSLCLFHALWRLRAVHGWALHVVHIDHGIRPEARAEAARVAATAAAWGVPCEVVRVDVPAYRQRARLNLQEAARYARYQTFAHLAAQLGAAGVLVGHTADDVAETLLLHLLRGAGLDGLAAPPLLARLPPGALGPPVERPLPNVPLPVGRPLLHVARADTGVYCAEHGLEPVPEVPTAGRRDRVRHELLLLLERFNPRARRVLAEAAFALAEERSALERWADEMAERVARREDDAVVFALDAWRGLPPALQKRLLRRAATMLAGSDAEPGRRVLTAALAAVDAPTGWNIAFPAGLRLERWPDALRLGPPRAVLPGPAGPWPLGVPGAVEVPGVGIVRAERHAAPPDALAVLPRTSHEAWLDADAVPAPLAVRWRRPGDRFQPLGLAQPKRLQDFLVDAHVPRARRDTLPLVVAGPGGDQIVWVVGVRIAEWARVRPDTRRILRLTFEPSPAAQHGSAAER